MTKRRTLALGVAWALAGSLAPAPALADTAALGTVVEQTGEAAKARTKVAVMEPKAEPALQELARALTHVVAEEIERLGPFETISSAEVQTLLKYEADRQLLGCDDASCLSEIGDALGADLIVGGALTRVGDKTVLQLQLIRVEAHEVVGRVSRERASDPRDLLEEARAAAKVLLREVLALRSGTVQVRSSEEGAVVSVDGRVVGTTPLGPFSLGGGLRTLQLEKDGFVDAVRDVEVPEGGTVEVRFTLIPSDEYREAYVRRAWIVRSAAFASLGVAAVGLAGGAGLYAWGAGQAEQLRGRIDAYNHATLRTAGELEAIRIDQRTLATTDALVVGAVAAGVVAAGIGAVLFAFGEDPGRYDELATERGPSR